MPRTKRHSCGELLDSVQCFEVIPAGFFTLKGEDFRLEPNGEDPNLVIETFRCNYCGDLLDHREREWVRSRLPAELFNAASVYDERLAA